MGGRINQGLGEDEVAGRGSCSGVGGQALPQTPTPQVTFHAVAAAAAASPASPALDSPAQHALNTPPPTQPVPSAAVQMAAIAPRFAATAAVGAASSAQHALPTTTPPTQPVHFMAVQQTAAARSAAAVAVGAASPAKRSLLITTPPTPSIPSAVVQQAAAAAHFAATAVGPTPLPHTLPSPVAASAAAAAAALQTAPTYGRGHPSATHGTDVFGRSYALLQSGANGAIAGHGGGGPSGSSGDGMTENFARATSNGENLHAFGGGMLSTSTNRQAQQSSSVSGQPEDLAVFENLHTPEYQRPRGRSKRHATGSATRGRGRTTRGPGEQLWSIAPR